MFCWGNSTYGELCLEQEDVIIRPTLSKWPESVQVNCIEAGESHSLYLTLGGKLYSCGSNAQGQLGRSETDQATPAEPVESFNGCVISNISCGANHSLALDEWGQPFSWGSDTMGQLGNNLDTASLAKPKIIKTLATKNVIQIACGENHSFALTSNGELFSWGANGFGQLGQGKISIKEATPQQVTSLAGIPIAMIACGYNHTFALSKSGAVFGWGKNTHGQLGIPDSSSHCYPTHLKSLRQVRVCHVSCGEDFTVFLTLDGGVYTCGSGEYGQTGHGSNKDELAPRRVLELMGSTVTQIACGRRHLLCRVGNKVFVCGYGARGQLGKPHVSVVLIPTPIDILPPDNSPPRKKLKQSWDNNVESNKSSSISHSNNTSASSSDRNFPSQLFENPIKIFAGGDHSFAAVAEKDDCDYRSADHKKQILTLSLPKLAACEMFKEHDTVNQEILAYVETVFGSMECLNGSFLLSDNDHFGCSAKLAGVDLKKAQKAFEIISRIENATLKDLIFNRLTKQILVNMRRVPPDVEVLRLFLVLPLYHEMRNPRRHPDLQGPFAEVFNNLSAAPQKIVCMWWEAQSTEYFEMLVDIFKSVVLYEIMQPTAKINKKIAFSHSIIQVLNALTGLNKINFNNPKKPKISAECFYIENLVDCMDIASDYINWLSDTESIHPHMCNYSFLFDVQCKSLLLKVDQQLQMHIAVSRATTQIITRLVFDPTYEYQRDQFLHLSVHRNSIVRDTMLQISNNDSSNLKKPLRVEFIGEEAEDAGGVRKEFFMLLLKEMFDPVYGMFTQSEETRMIWFSNNTFEEDIMYYLIGAIYGLAIYNSVIIYVPFPLVLYKKILGEPVMLDDLSDLQPTLASNLKSLLDYPDEDVEEVFCLCFAVNTVVFDAVQVHPLKPGGEAIAVTRDNRAEYVELYVDFLLNKSIEQRFNAFNQGFQKVCGGRIIKLFRSHELMSVVIGSEEYDWEAFECNTQYKNGYSVSDAQIRWFWEVFHELSVEDKKKFLLFLTGSDRIPIQGMSEVKIIIQPVADDRFYPVAHTCFNLLDLPKYKTKERLKYHLLQAIQQTQGFSLV